MTRSTHPRHGLPGPGAPCVPLLILVLLLAPVGLGAQDAGSVLDGVYTAEQADRGGTTFDRVCSYCHSTGEFSGSTFLRAWGGAAVGQFYRLVSTTMPYDGPGSLSRQQYTDVIAYILSLNDFPTGDGELPADPDILDEIRIEEPAERDPSAGPDGLPR